LRALPIALAAASAGLGLGLLGLNVVGLLRPAERVAAPASAAVPGYHDRRLPRAEAEAQYADLLAATAPGLEEARRLNRIVSDYLVHDEHVIQPWDNWYLWLLGFVDPMRRHTQDAGLLWRRGRGQCHQAAIVYAERARRLGFEPRLVWMNGHVIAQVGIPDAGWHAVDPDLGVFWPGTVDQVVAVAGEEGIARAIAERGHDPAWAESMAAVYASTDDNVVSLLPHLPELARAERAARLPKWAVPALLVLLGVAAAARARPSPDPAPDRSAPDR
jgi:hypothetical protein